MNFILKFFFILCILVWLYVYNWYNSIKNYKTKTDIIINVEKWQNITQVLVSNFSFNKNFLKLYFKLNPLDKNYKIMPWIFKIEKEKNINDIIKILWINPIINYESLTILEWYNIFDIDDYLTKKWFIKKWDFKAFLDSNLNKFKSEFIFLKDTITFEWFLFPDTYFFEKQKFNLFDFTYTLLDNFNKKVYIPLFENKNDVNIIKTINLASIVEKEASSLWWFKEKQIISWILLKRLDNNWPLWADITVCYPYELTSKECNQEFISKKVNTDINDYNTRTKLWLPKTPINNPGILSIKAILNPIKTDYFYYLHDKNWKIYYWKNLEEHNENKRLYLK